MKNFHIVTSKFLTKLDFMAFSMKSKYLGYLSMEFSQFSYKVYTNLLLKLFACLTKQAVHPLGPLFANPMKYLLEVKYDFGSKMYEI